MAKYVLLADAKRIFCEGCQFRYGCNPEGISVCPNHQRMNKAATDKVRPMVRAHWIDTSPINEETGTPFIVKGPHLKCSNCGSIEFQRKFCPECGADMRETGR